MSHAEFWKHTPRELDELHEGFLLRERNKYTCEAWFLAISINSERKPSKHIKYTELLPPDLFSEIKKVSSKKLTKKEKSNELKKIVDKVETQFRVNKEKQNG